MPQRTYGDLTLELPSGWQDSPTVVLLAPDVHNDFRRNITVSVSPRGDEDGAEQIRQIKTGAVKSKTPGLRILSEKSEGPRHSLTVRAEMPLDNEATYPVVTKTVVLEEEDAFVIASFTDSEARFSQTEPEFDSIVSSISRSRGA